MNTNRNLASAVFGLILIGLGIIFLVGQFVHFDIGAFLWPFFIIAVGGVFFIAMVAGGPSAGGLAIPGSIIGMVGLILLFQNTFGHWEAWSYGWTLILISVGIGMVIRGYWSKDESSRQHGWRVIRLGAIFFVIFGAFFELVIGFGRNSLIAGIAWPLLLILIGVYLFASRLLGSGRKNPPEVHSDDQQPPMQSQ